MKVLAEGGIQVFHREFPGADAGNNLARAADDQSAGKVGELRFERTAERIDRRWVH
jgi:hypothetical protein